jgi:cellulose synthase (UDP-forming)
MSKTAKERKTPMLRGVGLRTAEHRAVRRTSWMQAETMPTDAVRPDTNPAVPLLVEVMGRGQRFVFRCLAALWLLAQFVFWSWWFDPAHVAGPIEYLITTLLLAYFVLIPGYFLLLASNMKRPNPGLPLPMHLRVAMATSFVPGSESLEVLERTLRAMKAQQSVQADVWVLDEGDVPEVRALAERLGVYHFTRKNTRRYQQPDWPFKAKYKAGNYNAWLDWVGYEIYDVLVQLDTDHAPAPTYLQEILRPFSYPGVSYVAAPSDVTGNRKQSWLVMARAILDAPLHGPMQMGFNSRLCPIIIGSHSAIRVPALEHIGGFQQTRAEDHHNTLRLARFGYRGVYAPDALAVGDGPTSLGDALSQEFQWARSITVVLLRFFRRDAHGLPFWRWLEFFFCETWYTLYAGTFALGFAVPIVALLTNRPWAHVSYLDFLVHYELIDLVLVILLLWVRSQGWLRPRDCPIISWKSMLLVLARWPVMLWAVVDAVLASVLRRDFSFGVTFKGSGPGRPLAWSTLLPQYAMILVSLGVVEWYLHVFAGIRIAEGYILLALINAAIYAIFIVLVTVLHWRDARCARVTAPLRGITLKLMATFLAVAFMVTGVVNAYPQIVGSAMSAVLTSGQQPSGHGTQATSAATDIAPSRLPIVPLPKAPFVGAYDPQERLTAVPGVLVDHYFINWNQNVYGHDADTQIVADVRASQARGHFPMLTIEPWASPAEDKTPVLADIAAGRFAPQEERIAAALRAVAPQQAYIRFMHEMDLNGPYPWQTTNSRAFIAAFRQFVTYLRAAGVANAKLVWSPSFMLSPELSYYPGGDVVDIIGVSLFVRGGLPSATPLQDRLTEQLRLASELRRPLIIAEFGLQGLTSAQFLAVAQEAHGLLRQKGGLFGIVCYDAVNAPVWTPDGTVTWVLPRIAAWALFAGTKPPAHRVPSRG